MLGDRVGRTGVGAGAAGDAGRVAEALVEPGRDVRVEAAAGGGQREGPLDLVARAHAAPAGDAELVAEGQVGMARRRGAGWCGSPRQRGSPTSSCAGDLRPARCAARAARAARRGRARRRALATRRARLVVGVDRHPVAARAWCRRDRAGRALGADEADPAGAERAPGARRSRASARRARRRAPPRAPSRRGSTSTSLAVDGDGAHAQPQLLGEVGEQAADRRGHAAAVRAEAAEPRAPRAASSSALAVDRLVARRTSRARAAARSGTGSTCRSSRGRRSAAGAWRRRACRCGSSKATISPWPTMQPSRRAASKSNGVSSSERRAGSRRAGRRSARALIVARRRRGRRRRSSHSSRTVMPKRHLVDARAARSAR